MALRAVVQPWEGWKEVLAMNTTNPPAPPGSPPTVKFVGPWFSTQLILSLSIGVTSFLLFCFLRTRWEVVYMGRTKLKDFSPTPAHTTDGQQASASRRFFGWIIPTIRTSEYTVLQTVGLDAAVLLNFYRMSFLLFSLAAFLATVVLMPINLFRNGSTDAEPDNPSNDTLSLFPVFAVSANSTSPAATPRPSLYDLILDPQLSATLHLIFTYVFTLLCLTFFHSNFHRFVFSRQNFALQLIHSISARTVLVSNVPSHLRGDKALADYFEGCGWTVESVSVVREVNRLKMALKKRTDALLNLERAWADWVGNPAKVKGYKSNIYDSKDSQGSAGRLTASPQQSAGPLIPGLGGPSDAISSGSDGTNSRPSVSTSSNPSSDTDNNDDGSVSPYTDPEIPRSHHHIHTTRPRPTVRPRWLGTTVDAIEHWEDKFRDADGEVKGLRQNGRFEATHVAFVTFEDVKDAEIACQVVHYPEHSQVTTELAPEPRDVVWSKVSMSKREAQIRDMIVIGIMTVLLLTWIVPVTSLATLLSYQEIKKVLPWLARLIDRSPRLGAIAQNSLPSLALITFNGFLPFLLDWLSYQQGFRSKSATEYSLMKKYYLFLLISVLFIFLLTSTYWAIVRDLADTPAKIPEKLASALQGSNARNFMISYVMLQGLGLMPLQLLNFGPLITLGYSRLFTKTPRDYAEAYAPPMLNYGWVYPQALLIFTVTLVYSVVSPLILIFGAIYFGVGYVVYKYKLLFIYFKPYESNGEAWRITFARLLWGLIIFQLFMTGLFSLGKHLTLSLAMIPLILYTLWWSWTIFGDFGPLSRFLAISSICEVQRGEGVGISGNGSAGAGVEEVSRSQSNLNHRRYAINDETLYVAPSSKLTNYSQPPMTNFYYGVLNTGRRRYAHPALSGSLPTPWLPSLERPKAFGDGAAERRGVVLSLRRKMGKRFGKGSRGRHGNTGEEEGLTVPDGWASGSGDGMADNVVFASSPSRSSSRASGSGGSGVGLLDTLNPWSTPANSSSGLDRRKSYDPVSGVIALPEGNIWGDEDHEGSEDGLEVPSESPSTYYPHPERRRTLSGSQGVGEGFGGGYETGLSQ